MAALLAASMLTTVFATTTTLAHAQNSIETDQHGAVSGFDNELNNCVEADVAEGNTDAGNEAGVNSAECDGFQGLGN